jgi:hypothetical protein
MESINKAAPIMDGPAEPYEQRRIRELLAEIEQLDARLKANVRMQIERRTKHADSRVAIVNGRLHFRLCHREMDPEPELAQLEKDHGELLAAWNRSLGEYSRLKAATK